MQLIDPMTKADLVARYDDGSKLAAAVDWPFVPVLYVNEAECFPASLRAAKDGMIYNRFIRGDQSARGLEAQHGCSADR